MKKIHLWLLVVMSIFVTTLTVNATVHEEIAIGDLKYDLDDEDHTATVTGPANAVAPETVSIPSNVSYEGQTYAVTFIDSYAFSQCESLKSVTIPNSVKSIQAYCFDACYYLTSVSLPEGLESIGVGAFQYCMNLTSITIPNGVKSIQAYCFNYCYSLTSVSLPEGLESIGGAAFQYCESLTSITIPNGVKSIPHSCFYNCTNLSSVSLPEGLNEVDYQAFAYCDNLNRVTVYNPVPPLIEYNTFHSDNDSIIKSLYVPKGSVEAYESSDWKKYFANILEIDSSEVEEIGDCPTGINYSEPYEVFTLAGARVHADFDSLSPGIYIIRQGNLTEKLSVSN